VPSRDPSPSRSSSSSRSKSNVPARGPKVRTDGKVDVSCPQCATRYRVAEESLDSKIECQECHRVFFAKTTAGKRVAAPNNTKNYLLFGGGALVVLISLIVMSNSNDKPAPKPPAPHVEIPTFSPGNHPRTHQIVQWGKAMGSGNRLVISTHSDLTALATTLEVPPGDLDKICAAIATHDATMLFRELDCDSGTLADEATMSAPSGKATVYLVPKPGDGTYRKKTRGEIEVSFTMEGEQVKVTSWRVSLPPVRDKPLPSKGAFVANKDIAKPDEIEITDTAGTRKVKESKPAPVPHWEKATPAQQAKADQVVADIIKSADPEAPGTLFNRATMSVQTLDDKKAVVPRVLNAMYELYSDVTANNMKLSQLNKALCGFTGFAVNYELVGTGDATKDKALRESQIRQWFAFWWRYSSGDLSEFIDMRENLEEPLPDPKAPKDPKKTDPKK